MARRVEIPPFQSESEEAAWWDQHQEQTAEWMEEAIRAGETTNLSSVLRRSQKNSVVSSVVLQIDAEDVTRAQAQAAKSGIAFQAYLEPLLHTALEHAEMD